MRKPQSSQAAIAGQISESALTCLDTSRARSGKVMPPLDVRFTPKSGHYRSASARAGTSLFRLRRPQVWKLLEDVGVRLEARGRTLIFRQEGQAVIDHIVSEDPAVRILCRFRRIKTYHVWKCALLVDRSDRLFARVIAGVSHQVNELFQPALAVVDGLAGVIFLLGIIGVEEAAHARMAGAIDVKQLAVASHTAPAPDVHLWLGIDFPRRQLDHGRTHVRFCVRIHAGPWRLAAEMRLGEVPFAADVE